MKYQIKYTPIYQLPYCCVPATLQWILYRHGLNILDQETIGAELGLQLPLKGQKLFTNPAIIFTDEKPERGYGTQIHLPQYSIQKFFQNRTIPLQISELYNFNSIKDWSDFIVANLQNDHDLILRFHTGIFGEEKSNGHLGVIAAYDDNNQMITIGDPEMPFFREIPLEKLMLGMSNQFDGIERGVYVVK